MFELMMDPVPAAPALPPGDFVAVTRRINAATDLVAATLADPTVFGPGRDIDLGAAGWLRPEGAFVTVDGGVAWQARGRLYVRRRGIVRYARVELEVSAWSAHASQLWLRPTCRSPLRWGRRRLRSYLDAAHLAADVLVAVVTRVATEEVDASLGWYEDDVATAA
jgi:hypothetical protein